MRIVAVIQARLASTRLPGKALMEIRGRPMVAHVVERARAIPQVREVVATVPPEDRELLSLLRRLGVRAYPHKPPDVLAGFHAAARGERADVVVRLTGDCPLLCPEVSGLVLELVLKQASEYATNDTRYSGYPDGLDTQAFTRKLIERARRFAWRTPDLEHVCLWMERAYPVSLLWAGAADGRWPKLSVDTREDLDRVRAIAGAMAPGDFSLGGLARAVGGETR